MTSRAKPPYIGARRWFRFMGNCVRLGPSNALWVLEYERHEA